MFCPRCGSILIPKKKRKTISCSCGYSSKNKQNLIIKEKIELDKRDTIEVIDKTIETLPKTDEECPKCKNKKAYYWSVQTRAGDEAETRFFECTKCKYRWRSYK
jgi:DNA-directed RNA polymerase subunit M